MPRYGVRPPWLPAKEECRPYALLRNLQCRCIPEWCGFKIKSLTSQAHVQNQGKTTPKSWPCGHCAEFGPFAANQRHSNWQNAFVWGRLFHNKKKSVLTNWYWLGIIYGLSHWLYLTKWSPILSTGTDFRTISPAIRFGLQRPVCVSVIRIK